MPATTRLRRPTVQAVTAIAVVLLVVSAVPTSATPPGGVGAIAYTRLPATGPIQIRAIEPDGTSDRLVLSDSSASPAWSPTAEQLAYTKVVTPDTQIWVANPDGSDPHMVIDLADPVEAPTWSPDGSQIAFVVRTSVTDIWVADADGSNPTALTSTPANDHDPAWSPDGSRIAFSRATGGPPSTSDVWVMDADGRNPQQLSTGGSDIEPSWSPDGQRVAFRSQRTGDSEIFLMNADGSNQVNFTTDPTEQLQPSWSPDGTRIAYASEVGGSSIIVAAEVAAPHTTLHLTSGPNDYQPAWQRYMDPVERLWGTDRIETAIAVADHYFGSAPGAPGGAVLARADLFPDALAGTPLARAVLGPLLLTPTARLDDRVAATLQRLVPAGTTVHLLGGEAALSADVESAVAALGYPTRRVAGTDRFETATLIADEIPGAISRVFLATGLNFPDALSAGTAAAAGGGIVLLTADDRMPPVTQSYLSQLAGVPRTAVGGQAAAADTGAQPLIGADRYDTARRVAVEFFPQPAEVAVASGVAFPDGLTGGVFAAFHSAPLLLVSPDQLRGAPRDYLINHAPTADVGWVFGGQAAVGEQVWQDVRKAISGVVP